MNHTPNSERLVCPKCSAKLVSTKTVKLPDNTLATCLTCKSKFSLAQGRLKNDHIEPRGEPESNTSDPSPFFDLLPPPLEFPHARLETPETVGALSHFENESAFSMRTKGLAKEVVEAVRPRIGEIPTDIEEVLDLNDIVFANNPSGTAKVLKQIVLLICLSPFLLLILFQTYLLLSGDFSIGMLATIFLEWFGLAIPFVLLHLAWKNTFYVITRDKIVVRSGIFNRAIKIAWVRNIQEVSINSGVVDRWLNLNTIHFSTASSGLGGLMLGWIPGSTLGGIYFRNVELKSVLRGLKSLEL